MNGPSNSMSWPEWGVADPAAQLAEIDALPSVYEVRPRPFSFPGTAFLDADRPDVAATIAGLVRKQYNLLGTHTRGLGGKWGEAQAIEKKAVEMVLSLVGGDRERADGYFCAGGTEANLVGMWIGREWLRRAEPVGDRRIAALATPVSHYSFLKGLRLLDIGTPARALCPRCGAAHGFQSSDDGSGLGWLPMTEEGALCPAGLESVLARLHRKGVRKFLLFLNVGSTLLGSVDSVEEVSARCAGFAAATGSAVFIHVDACFGGFTLPFLEGAPTFGFEHPLVGTVALDGRQPHRESHHEHAAVP